MNQRLRCIVNRKTKDHNPYWYNDDTWKYSYLGIDGNQGDRRITFTFKRIHPTWLKKLSKQYILFTSINKSAHFIQRGIGTLTSFSAYLLTVPKVRKMTSADQINRKLIIGYFIFLTNRGYSKLTRSHHIFGMARFFDLCHEKKWLILNEKLIFPSDLPKLPNNIPRFIPESVLMQLNAKLDCMEPHIKRLLLVLQETGMRIGELIMLSYDCIYPDKEEDYFLKYFQSKMNKEHVIPISETLANTILTQQEAVKKEWGRGKNRFLFPVPRYMEPAKKNASVRLMKTKGKQWARRTLANYLHDFANLHQIKGPDGKIWRFNFHAFRHTVATRMINNQVPQHFVQRFLGHESSEMTSRYAHIHDQTLKKAFNVY